MRLHIDRRQEERKKKIVQYCIISFVGFMSKPIFEESKGRPELRLRKKSKQSTDNIFYRQFGFLKKRNSTIHLQLQFEECWQCRESESERVLVEKLLK